MGDISGGHGGCETCARVCEEAKTRSASLEKKNFRLAMALTSALTLLGEQGVKAVMGVIESMHAVADEAPKPPTTATGSAAGGGYRFGGGRGGAPQFSGWKPSWTGIDDGGSNGDLWLPSEGWSGPKDVSLASVSTISPSGILSYAPSSYILTPAEPPLSALAMDIPSSMLLPAVAIHDFTTPSPFGGYRAHLEAEPSHVSTIPHPGTLCVFAVGGMFGSRSRA